MNETKEPELVELGEATEETKASVGLEPDGGIQDPPGTRQHLTPVA